MERSDDVEPIESPPLPPDTSDIVKQAFVGDPKIRARGEFDYRSLSIIRDKEIPLLIAMELMGDTSETDPWKLFVRLFLKYRISTGAGRGRKDLLRAEQVSHGLPVRMIEETHQPGWFGRNFTQRDWERKERKRILEESGEI